MTTKGIDVSKYQNSIDFNKVKAAGVQFVMIRIGFRGYANGALILDPMFEHNYAAAREAGLGVGGYFFSQAITATEGSAEADFCMKAIGKKEFDYPIAIDTEASGAKNNSGRADKISNAVRTLVVQAFCERMEECGYYAAIYCSDSWLNSKLNKAQLTAYDKWLAKWSMFEPDNSCGMWQNSNSGNINGITGRVDTDIAYKDYPTIIKEHGLNNLSPKTVYYNVTVKGITNGDKVTIVNCAKALVGEDCISVSEYEE